VEASSCALSRSEVVAFAFRTRARSIRLSASEARPSWGSAPSWGVVGSSGTLSSASAFLFVLRFRPDSSPSRHGSRGHRNDTCFVPSWTLRSFPSFRAVSDGRSDRAPLQGCILFRDCSHAGVAGRLPRPPLFGFWPLRRFRRVRLRLRAATPSTPAPAGFGHPRGAFLSASHLPGMFRPGPSLGLRPSGLFPSAGSSPPLDGHLPSCRSAARSRASCVLRLQGVPEKAVTRRGLLRRRRAAAPLDFVASPGFSTRPVSPLARTPSQASRSPGSGPDDRCLTGQPNRPVGSGLE
jgi:hypothetical protein